MAQKKGPSSDLLQDLVARFILNCPSEELQSFERMLFLVEQAHWYYEDVSRVHDTNLKTMHLKDFCQLIFQEHPSLHQHLASLEEIYGKWQAYKFSIPVFGAIVLNPEMDKCLMVQGMGKNSGWGFPKGKMNKDEPDAECAVREVLEEVGLDIAGIVDETAFVETERTGQRTKLFIVRGVPESTGFATQTRGEIGQIAWHYVEDLPFRRDPAQPREAGEPKYYMVQQFVGQLRKWIGEQRRQGKGKGKGQRAPPGFAGQQPQQQPNQQQSQQQGAAVVRRCAPSLLGFRLDAAQVCAPMDHAIARMPA